MAHGVFVGYCGLGASVASLGLATQDPIEVDVVVGYLTPICQLGDRSYYIVLRVTCSVLTPGGPVCFSRIRQLWFGERNLQRMSR